MKREAYPAVDIAKFVLAILVVAIHVKPFGGIAGFLYNNCVARIADPLFFSITAFFMFRKAFEQNLSWRSLGKYMLRIGLLYGCWVLIYAPVILQRAVYVAGGGWTLIRYLLQQIFLSGPYGALWFLTALLLAIPLTFVITKYLGPAAALLLSLPFYLFFVLELGYTNLVGDLPFFSRAAEMVTDVFIFLWNGLTFGFFFCALGMWIAWRQKQRESAVGGSASVEYLAGETVPGKNAPDGGWGDTLMGKASLVCLGSLVAESLLLYRFHLGMDYAAQFSLIPLTYFLLRWLLSLRFAERKRYRYLRKASILIFTIHYGVMELLRSLFSDAAWYTESTTVQYVFVLAVTLLLTAAILYLSEHVRGCGWLRVLY